MGAGFLALTGGAFAAVTNTAPTTSAGTYSVLLNTALTVNLVSLAKDTTPTATGLRYTFTQPANGSVTKYTYGSYVYEGYMTYTPNTGFTGTDTFRFTVTDGEFVSNESTITIKVLPNSPPQLLGATLWATPGMTTPNRLQIGGLGRLIDPDVTQPFSYEITTPPSKGTIKGLAPSSYGARWGATFTYEPQAGFIGEDYFEARASDGIAWSEPARYRIVVREAGKPAGALVLIVVEGAIATELDPELQRLKADLEAEGWTARIVPWTKDARALWDYARTEYLNKEQCLVGALLIGNVPVPGNPHNLWQLWKYRTNWFGQPNGDPGSASITSDFGADIWVSRFKAQDVWQLRNALEANHRYRSGQSRLPERQWRFVGKDWGDWATSPYGLQRVWPTEVLQKSMWEAFAQGTEHLIMFEHDGGGDGIEGTVTTPGYPVQARFYTDDGCAAGGRRARSSLYSRGGSNVTSFGPASTWGGGGSWGYNLLSQNSGVEAFTRGVALGSLMMTEQRGGFPHYANYYLHWGDLSLAYKKTGNNALPVATIKGPTTAVRMGQPAAFTVSLSDSDAAQADNPKIDYKLLADFWPTGFGEDGKPGSKGGRREPGITRTYADGSTSDSFVWTYDRPHVYTVRVEAQDEWFTRHGVETTVAVAPDPSRPLRILAGGTASDLTDSKGALWLYDQTAVAGTWGRKTIWGYIWEERTTSPIAQTGDPALFQTCVGVNGGITYQVPVTNGTYQVKLGFADFLNNAVGSSVTDIQIEGATVLDNYDVFAEVGARTAVVKTFTANVADGLLEITLVRDKLGKANSFLNNIEILPVSPYQAWMEAKRSAPPTPDTPSAPVLAPEKMTETADADGDGLSNLMEYALDLNPVAMSAPVAGYSISTDPELRLTFFRARAELTYVVECSADLVNWTTVATNPGTVGTSVTVPAPPSASARCFLRLRVVTP